MHLAVSFIRSGSASQLVIFQVVNFYYVPSNILINDVDLDN